MRLTDEQLDFYNDNGYVTIPSLFAPSESQDLSRATESLVTEVKQQFQSKGLENQFEELRGSQVVLSVRPDDQAIAIKRIVWAGDSSPLLLDKGRDLKIVQKAAQILVSLEADHLINQLHVKEPGDGVGFLWHQDEQNRRSFDPEWDDCGSNGSYVVAITAIHKCTVENGALFVIPGSHKFGYLNFGAFLNTEELQSRFMAHRGVNVADIQKSLLMEPGDTVFMHPRLIHASWPNTSNEPRHVLINGFSYPGANHCKYPGTGSTRRINLSNGKEVDMALRYSINAMIGMNTRVQPGTSPSNETINEATSQPR